MPCPDGVRLATRLWRPEGEGPWPVLLMRQPYGRAIASTVTYAHPSWYAARGFLVAVQDVRGRGDSQGSFGGFAQEAADGAAAVRWARTLPGGSGRVGTYGFSYQGLTQLLSEAPSGDPDPLPDALAPAMCGLDERLHWASEGGAHWWALGVGWGLQLAAEGCRRRGDAEGWRAIRLALESGGFLREGLALLERHDPRGMALEWLRRDPAVAAGWRVHGVAPALLRRPLLLIGGWSDPHLRGVLDLWRRARAAGGSPLLRIGAWCHLDWNGGVDELQLAFFRRHLLPPGDGPDPGPDPAVRLQCPRTGAWRDGSDPDGCGDPGGTAEPERLWRLASDGRAAIRSDEGRLLPGEAGGPPREDGVVVLVHDPWRPVPARGGHLGGDPGEIGRGDLDRRSDVACFTGAPLAQALELVAEPVLQLRAAADQPGFDLCAALSRVSADGGRVVQLATGIARFLGEDCHRPRERTVRLQPLHLSLAAGERLRLSLAGAAWPQFAVNPGDGTLPAGGSGPGHRVITITLHLAGASLRLEPLGRSASP
ncbi:MAG: CocE/NonD family hydrolase [Synechococcaceae cyanobacterium]|nr:CocE/NonD family hydrolase [Synechococcaceae cyanobacterium]